LSVPQIFPELHFCLSGSLSGVLHGDIKPENILQAAKGFAVKMRAF
jgi:serine/threonine protein kinase